MIPSISCWPRPSPNSHHRARDRKRGFYLRDGAGTPRRWSPTRKMMGGRPMVARATNPTPPLGRARTGWPVRAERLVPASLPVPSSRRYGDVEIRMHESIAHSDDPFPRYFRQMLTCRIGDPRCRLADDLDILDRRESQLAIVGEAARSSTSDGHRLSRGGRHVRQTDFVIPAHAGYPPCRGLPDGNTGSDPPEFAGPPCDHQTAATARSPYWPRPSVRVRVLTPT